MRIIVRFLIVAGFLLVLGTISAACGGDDELTLEEFFQQSDAIYADFGMRALALTREFPDDDYQTYRVFFGKTGVLFAEFIDELETLNPPSEAEDAFDEFLTAGSEFAESHEGLADLFGEAESFTELSQLSRESEASPAFSASQERYQDACRSLQEIADANGIVADLECSEVLQV